MAPVVAFPSDSELLAKVAESFAGANPGTLAKLRLRDHVLPMLGANPGWRRSADAIRQQWDRIVCRTSVKKRSAGGFRGGLGAALQPPPRRARVTQSCSQSEPQEEGGVSLGPGAPVDPHFTVHVLCALIYSVTGSAELCNVNKKVVTNRMEACPEVWAAVRKKHAECWQPLSVWQRREAKRALRVLVGQLLAAKTLAQPTAGVGARIKEAVDALRRADECAHRGGGVDQALTSELAQEGRSQEEGAADAGAL